MPTALVVAEYGTLNGGERSLLAVIPGLQQAGWEVLAAVPDQTCLASCLRRCDVGILPFAFRHEGRRQPLPELRQRFFRLFQEVRPDLVHCNSLSTSRIVGPVSRRADLPSLGYLRDIIGLTRQMVGDLNLVDCLVAVSQATRQHHIAQGIHAHRLQVIYNGVDACEFCPGPAAGDIRIELNWPANAPVVLFAGQIGLRKGLDTWLATATKILQHEPSARFLIVGERHSAKRESIELQARLLDQSRRSPLKGHVHWLGRRTDVADLMRQSTVLLHCARQEPLGRVLLEACASGLPVVATDVGGTREILHHPALSACLIPVDQPEAGSLAVRRLLEDPSWLEKSQRLVRDIAINSFSVSACCQNLLASYSMLLANRCGD
jgi:glycosyltransferase involved in cell wall biosynthesis